MRKDMITPPLPEIDFVGRQEELAYLRDQFAAVARGRLRFVAVEGDAGIGKSRLAAELCSGIPAGQAVTIFGECSDVVRRPYLPFIPLFQHLEVGHKAFARQSADAEPEGEERWRFYAALADAIRLHTAGKPLITVLEDLHWADTATLDCLRFLVTHATGSRVLLLATLRPDDSLQNAPLINALAFASRHGGSVLRLHGLRHGEIRRLARGISQLERRPLTSELIARIEELSEGNPLFVEELTRASMRSDSPVRLCGPSLPLTLQAMLSERLASFTEAEREILIRAAALGQTFEADFLSDVAQTDLADVLRVLSRACAAQLVVASQREANRFTFRHAAIRHALADQLILALAAPLHIRIAQALESRGDAEANIAQLAYHWSAARVADKARYYNERAAIEAVAVYAYGDAIRFYREALRWSYPAGPQRAVVYERLGTLLYTEAQAQAPQEYFELCRREYAALGDRRGTAQALLRLADQYWVDARTGESLHAANEAMEQLEGVDHPEMYGRAHLTYARFASTLGDPVQALRYLRSAEAFADFFDHELSATFYEISAEANAALGNTLVALEHADRASQFAVRTTESDLIAQVQNNTAMIACECGDLKTAIARHEVSLAEAGRTGMLWRVAYCALCFAQTLTMRTRLDDARKLVRQALETGVDTKTFITKAAAVGIPLALMLNDRTLLERCADESALSLAFASGEIQRIGSVGAAFVELRAAQGARDEARTILRRALSAIPRANRCWPIFHQAALHGDRGDREQARRILRATPTDAQHGLLEAHMQLCDAWCAPDDQRATLARRAAAHFRALGWSLYETLACEAAGDELSALERYATMGNVRDAQRLKNQMSRPYSVMRLTARQKEVAALVAAGASNRTIAQRLNISENTVEHHLSSIFDRLGIGSRSQLTARILAEPSFAAGDMAEIRDTRKRAKSL